MVEPSSLVRPSFSFSDRRVSREIDACHSLPRTPRTRLVAHHLVRRLNPTVYILVMSSAVVSYEIYHEDACHLRHADDADKYVFSEQTL